MSIKDGLFSFLTGSGGLVALVGDRVYPAVIPAENFDSTSQKPCVTYERSSVQRGQTLCGTDSLSKSSFRVTCFARQPEAAEAVSEAVLDAILDYRGPMGADNVHTVTLDDQFDGADIEPGIFRVDLLLSIWHSNP